MLLGAPPPYLPHVSKSPKKKYIHPYKNDIQKYMTYTRFKVSNCPEEGEGEGGGGGGTGAHISMCVSAQTVYPVLSLV